MKTCDLLYSLIVLCLFSVALQAQDYNPFPEGDARWSGQYTGHFEDFPNTTRGFYYQTAGDTIIDNNNYQKLYYQSTWTRSTYYDGDELVINTSNSPGLLQLVGALRQDIANKKVYYRHFGYPQNSAYYCYHFDFPTDEDILL